MTIPLVLPRGKNGREKQRGQNNNTHEKERIMELLQVEEKMIQSWKRQ